MVCHASEVCGRVAAAPAAIRLSRGCSTQTLPLKYGVLRYRPPHLQLGQEVPDEDFRLRDKCGVAWQIVPKALMRLLGDNDAPKAARVMQSMMQMTKIDVAGLERAAAG